MLRATFDANGGANEACLAGGDSGGGVFIQNAGVWQLAGVNLSVDGPFNTTDSGAGFFAALFDTGGLYRDSGGNWLLVPSRPWLQPAGWYATRVSARLAWIQGIISAHGGETAPVLEAATAPQGPYAPAAAAVSVESRTVAVPLPAQNQFYRLSHCQSLRITQVAVKGGSLVLGYE